SVIGAALSSRDGGWRDGTSPEAHGAAAGQAMVPLRHAALEGPHGPHRAGPWSRQPGGPERVTAAWPHQSSDLFPWYGGSPPMDAPSVGLGDLWFQGPYRYDPSELPATPGADGVGSPRRFRWPQGARRDRIPPRGGLTPGRVPAIPRP